MTQAQRTLTVGYFGGAAVYILAQAIYGWELGYRSVDWVKGVALHALFSFWWPLLLLYALPHL